MQKQTEGFTPKRTLNFIMFSFTFFIDRLTNTQRLATTADFFRPENARVFERAHAELTEKKPISTVWPKIILEQYDAGRITQALMHSL
jgi:hypothetical protein